MAGPVPGVGAVDVAPPDRRPLLGLAHQHESRATGCHGRASRRDAPGPLWPPVLKRTTGTLVRGLKRLELGDEPFVVAVEQGRGTGWFLPG